MADQAAGTARSRPTQKTVADIRDHPGFPEAFDVFVDALANLYGHSARMRGLLEYRAGICAQLLVCFDAARDPSRPETLFTASTIAAAMAGFGVRNRRGVGDLVRRLREDGFATVVPADHDRRVREIRATEKAWAADRQWLAVMQAPLASLWPEEVRYRLGVEQDVAYHHAYRSSALKALGKANTVMATSPEVEYFIRANVGSRVMMVMFQAIRGRADRRTDPGFYNWAAERAGVSRPHVRKLMLGAEELGLVRLSGDSAITVEVMPQMIKGLEAWTAAALTATDWVSLAAWADLRGEPSPA